MNMDEFLLFDEWANVEEGIQSDIKDENIDQYILDSLQNECNNYMTNSNFYLRNDTTTSMSCSSTDDLQYLSNFEDPNIYHPQQAQKEYWARDQIQKIIDNPTNPVGRFLRKSYITAEIAEKTNIMPFLVQAPRKPREKYGKRYPMTKEQKDELNRERNRCHARRTRQRNKIFKTILSIRDHINKKFRKIESQTNQN